jgi:hypothetical protein
MWTIFFQSYVFLTLALPLQFFSTKSAKIRRQYSWDKNWSLKILSGGSDLICVFEIPFCRYPNIQKFVQIRLSHKK